MLATNTMQRGTGNFEFRRQALFKTTDPLDTQGETSITGFVISGTEPEGTSRKIIFEVDEKLFYFTHDGLTAYPYHGELADILEHGNTVAELLEVNGIVRWLNKKIYPIVALDAPFDAEIMPKIKIGLKVNCFNDEYIRNEFSPVFELKHPATTPARITSATFNKSINGYAKVNMFIRLRNILGDWGDWQEFSNVTNLEACAVQFKATYILTALDGSDEVKIFDVKVSYVTDAENLAGNTLELFTSPQSYYVDLGTCYAMIKHSELFDAKITARIKYDSSMLKREDIIIGKGTGQLETYFLGINGGIDPNINQNTLRITAGGVNIIDFYYNTTNASVTFSAGEGLDIKASYEYGLEIEMWKDMVGELTQVGGDGVYTSRFIYRSDDSEDKKISAVRFTIQRGEGTVTNQFLGKANGATQFFVLPHRALKETISVNGAWTYDEATQILQVTGTIGDDLKVSYDWNGIIPTIYNYTIGWTPAT